MILPLHTHTGSLARASNDREVQATECRPWRAGCGGGELPLAPQQEHRETVEILVLKPVLLSRNGSGHVSHYHVTGHEPVGCAHPSHEYISAMHVQSLRTVQNHPACRAVGCCEHPFCCISSIFTMESQHTRSQQNIAGIDKVREHACGAAGFAG